jgi:hypothetical protein
MPKLRKITHYVDTLQRRIEAHTSYSDGKFRVALGVEYADYANSLKPQEGNKARFNSTIAKPEKDNKFSLYYWRSAGKSFVGVIADTEAEAELLWNNFLKHFYEQTQEVEKVILYKISFQSIHIKQSKQGYFDDEVTEADKFNFDTKAWRDARNADSDSNGAKIFFDFMVCEKRTIGKESRYYFIDKKGEVDTIGNRHGSAGFSEYPYSPEAEGFFAAMYTGLEDLMKKISKYLGNNGRIATSIASSQKLLA